MSVVAYAITLTLFLGSTFGLGLGVVLSWRLDPLEKLTTGIAVGLVLLFLGAFALYAGGLPWTWFRLLPVLAAAGLAWRRRDLIPWLRDPEVWRTLAVWALVAAWTQGLLAVIENYSGAAWGNDWLEHHHRTRFFLQHWPLDYVFVGFYRLTARPPLANIVTAGFEALTAGSFPCDQVVLALWSSFVVFPAVLFYRRAGGKARGLPVLAVLLMLNPAFVQNSTFAWTKLPAAFFVLAGAYFLFTALDSEPSSGRFALAAGMLAAGVLVHYSAAPYAVVLAGAWLWRRAVADRGAGLAREAAFGLAAAAPLLAVWFGWALAHYGWRGTFLTNSTVLDAGPFTFGSQLQKIAGNLWVTLVPHPLRTVDYSMIHQTDVLAWFRDYFFLINQVNLPAMVGSGGAVALTALLIRDWRGWRKQTGAFGPPMALGTLTACAALGVAVVSTADQWGLAHVCLQALDVLGLAVLAARIGRIGRVAATVLAFGLAWDTAINIGLHYYLQSQPAPPEWLTAHNWIEVTQRYGPAAFNAWLKHLAGVRFLHDGFVSAGATAMALAGLLAVACGWAVKAAQTSRGEALSMRPASASS